MILSKFKWAALAALVTGFAFTSAGVMARQDPQAESAIRIAPGGPAAKPYGDGSAQRKVAGVYPKPKSPRPSQKGVPSQTRRPITESRRKAGSDRGRGRGPGQGSQIAPDPREARRADLDVVRQRDATGRRPQVHQAGDDDPHVLGHPDLRRSPRPARSRAVAQLDGATRSGGCPAAPDLAADAHAARPGLLRRGWDARHHIGRLGEANPCRRRCVVPTPLTEKMEKAERGDLTMKEMEDLLKYLKTRESLLRQGLHDLGGRSCR